MMEQDIVDFCNEAHKLERMAEGYLAKMSAGTLARLRGFIRSEFETPHADIAPGQKFLAEMIDIEIAAREHNPTWNFENAISTYLVEAGKAQGQLVDTLIAMPAEDWDRAAEIISNWIERGSSEATSYVRVLEEVAYERGRIAANSMSIGRTDDVELPF
ncbi:hypothetical protein [Mesorhizobium sp. IMUNJ 23232]|uniref:hypothetical protein n=1 Tax=Mesorhizobium sp. IMUNJ 23232 TaxID=3376064 RepID=UPI0037BD6EFF